MSAIGAKRTSLVAPHMSAIGGKADMAPTCVMSAYDPKRTLHSNSNDLSFRSMKLFHRYETPVVQGKNPCGVQRG